MNAEYADLPDEALDLECALLERKCSALRYATSRAGIAMLRALRERLAQVRVELDRRRRV